MSQNELFRDSIMRDLEELSDRKISEQAKDKLEEIINDLEEINLD